jgi:hypothetical protein
VLAAVVALATAVPLSFAAISRDMRQRENEAHESAYLCDGENGVTLDQAGYDHTSSRLTCGTFSAIVFPHHPDHATHTEPARI